MKMDALKSLFCQFKITILAAMLLGFANMGFLLDGARNGGFQSFCAFMEYDRTLIFKGELWRLLTGHLIHWSPEHFYLDVSVFLALSVAFEQKIGRIYGSVLFIAGLAISLTLLIFQPNLAIYRGVSGLINTQIILGTGLYLFEPNLSRLAKGFYAAIFSSHLFKTAYEAVFQTSLFSTQSLGHLGLFTPLAHAAGVSVAFYFLIGNGFKTTRRNPIYRRTPGWAP